MDKMEGTSLDLTKFNIEKLKELFPNIVTEGKIDFDMLRTVLGDEVDNNREKYQFTWNGKSDAIKIAQMPSSATLRPSKEDSKDWETTGNLYIEGDNLEVLKQLQKTYYSKIKLIYIDPPYNTGTNLIYKNNFYSSIDDYNKFTNQSNEEGLPFMSNPTTNGRYHSDWDSMMYSRLILARNFLKKDGLIAIAIDENELATLTLMCDEIYGESNRLAIICVVHKPEGRNQAKFFGPSHEYMLVYAKDSTVAKLRKVLLDDERRKEFINKDTQGSFKLKNFIRMSDGKYSLRENKPSFYYPAYVSKELNRLELEPFDGCVSVFPITEAGQARTWKTTPVTMKERFDKGEILIKQEKYGVALYEKLREEEVIKTHWINKKYHGFHFGTKIVDELLGIKSFDFPKSVFLMKDIIKLLTDKGDIILDFFSGSGTTAHAIFKQNFEDNCERKFILIQLPEKIDSNSEAYSKGYRTICDLGKERIRKAADYEKSYFAQKKHNLFELDNNSNFNVDVGFKVFTLDSTNIQPWDNNAILTDENVLDLDSVFKSDRKKEDILYEIMLKYGIFDLETSEVIVNNKTMYRVGKRYMIVCLEDVVTNEDVKAIAELTPKVVVFKEAGFQNDNDKINAVYNLKNAGVEDVKCI
ncbi:MAG: site-specific DNA-methyltransferase [Erysipelotrichaceae bacterium]